MALTYADHVDGAARAAALVLTTPTPTGPDLDAVLALHDDLTTTLTEATRIVWLSALGEPRAERERAGIPAAQTMLTALELHPRLSRPDTAQAPAERWSGRPPDLSTDVTGVDAWRVLVAETFLARSCLDQMQHRLTTPIRATILSDLAVTTDVLATATADLATAADIPGRETVLVKTRELAAAARQVEQDATPAIRGGATPVPAVPAAREARRVQIIRQRSDIADALGNLARLSRTGRPRAGDLFATATMLATMADTLAAALNTAEQTPSPRDPASLSAASARLTQYRGELTRLVREHQPKLASLGPGNPAALAQARELRTAGVPRLQQLADDPAGAAGAIRELQVIAAGLAPATAAVRAGFVDLDTRGAMLTYDWAPGPGLHWRAATSVDAEGLLAQLEAATSTVARLRPSRLAEPSSAGASHAGTGRSSISRIVDLTEAIDRRRAAMTAAADTTSGRAPEQCAANTSLQPSPRATHAGAAPAIRR